jgi:hypothetical protein
MLSELWFYLVTVLISAGFPLLIQSYPRWKIYLSIGFALFIIGGAVLTYFDVKEKEEHRAKKAQLEQMLEEANMEIHKQKAAAADEARKADLLAEQLRTKTDEIRNVLKERPKVDGEISQVRLFPWQRHSGSRRPMDELATTMGILVYAHVENQGSGTTLANWELSIELPDHTIMKPQKWPIQKNLRISCEDGPITISKDEYLDLKSKQAVQKNQDRSGVTVWMVKTRPIGDSSGQG